MALSSEDKADVARKMGKKMAGEVERATWDRKKSTRTHFMGTGTKLEEGKKGKLHGVYHGTKVATRGKEGDLHFRTGGWRTPTTVRRMETFAKEHGGRDLKISRAKGMLRAFEGGKEIARSGYKGGEDLMTIKKK